MIRAQRYNIGDEVIVSNCNSARYWTRGAVVEVPLSGEVDLTLGGGVNDTYHALYKVRFDWNGFDAPQPATYDEFFDWELSPVTEK